MYWYEHRDDLQFKIRNIVYTKQDFDEMSPAEQETILKEVSSLCVRKHAVDKLSCDDTAYWLANSLEDEGVEADLAIAWMGPCSDACHSEKAPPSIVDRPGKRTGI